MLHVLSQRSSNYSAVHKNHRGQSAQTPLTNSSNKPSKKPTRMRMTTKHELIKLCYRIRYLGSRIRICCTKFTIRRTTTNPKSYTHACKSKLKTIWSHMEVHKAQLVNNSMNICLRKLPIGIYCRKRVYPHLFRLEVVSKDKISMRVVPISPSSMFLSFLQTNRRKKV